MEALDHLRNTTTGGYMICNGSMGSAISKYNILIEFSVEKLIAQKEYVDEWSFNKKVKVTMKQYLKKNKDIERKFYFFFRFQNKFTVNPISSLKFISTKLHFH